MILSFINICKVPREVLKTSDFALGGGGVSGILRMLCMENCLIPLLYEKLVNLLDMKNYSHTDRANAISLNFAFDGKISCVAVIVSPFLLI